MREEQAFFWLNYRTVLYTGRDGLLSFCSLQATASTACSITFIFPFLLHSAAFTRKEQSDNSFVKLQPVPTKDQNFSWQLNHVLLIVLKNNHCLDLILQSFVLCVALMILRKHFVFNSGISCFQLCKIQLSPCCVARQEPSLMLPVEPALRRGLLPTSVC